MKQFFNEQKKLGFGLMRLPMRGDQVDMEELTKMVDLFLERGFNYFDTAHGYVGGKSETAIREALTSRVPRERYILTDKLSTHHFTKAEEIRPLFESQLEACGVEYFDFYLMHAQDANIYAKYQRLGAYEIAYGFKAEGKIKHFGISFHDRAEVLEKILTEHPEVEVVQMQFNYADYEDPSVESRKVYEVAQKHGKPVIVMEPIKGGSLLALPDAAQKIYDDLGGGSNASYALRFAAGFENIMMVLSGMSRLADMEENTATMGDFQPLSDRELDAVKRVVAIFKEQDMIPCTACRYCMEECPKGIRIPDLFALLNAKRVFHNWNTDYYYNNIHTGPGTKASDCLKCGKCERICPQHLPIRDLLVEVAGEFEA